MATNTYEHEQIHTNIKKPQNWSRLLYMLIFGFLLNLAGAVMWALSALQFIFVLTSGTDSPQLRSFGRSVARFVEQGLLFVSYNTDTKPFPFGPWPEAEPEVSPEAESEVSPEAVSEVSSGSKSEVDEEPTQAQTAVEDSTTDNEDQSADKPQ